MGQLRLWLCAVLAAGCLGGQGKPAKPAAANFEIHFSCLWWSEAQMEGLNPNAPPPKTTEVRIRQWEYSDPVGVPHPDTVDAVVTFTDESEKTLAGLEVEFQLQWKIGRYGRPKTAVMGPAMPLRKVRAAKTIRVPIDLKAMMDSLDKQDRWPFLVRVMAVSRRVGSAEVVGVAQADLPIKQGD